MVGSINGPDEFSPDVRNGKQAPILHITREMRLTERAARLAGAKPNAKQLRDPKQRWRVISGMWGRFPFGHVFVREDVPKFNSALPTARVELRSGEQTPLALTDEQQAQYWDLILERAWANNSIRMTDEDRKAPPEETKSGDLLARVLEKAD